MIIGLSLKSDQGSNCWATDLYWGHTGLPRSGPRPGREVTIRSAGQNAGHSFQWWFHHKENQSTEISPGDWSIKNGLPKLYDLIRRLAGFYGSVYGKAYVKPWLFRLFRLFWPCCGVSSGECVFFFPKALANQAERRIQQTCQNCGLQIILIGFRSGDIIGVWMTKTKAGKKQETNSK